MYELVIVEILCRRFFLCAVRSVPVNVNWLKRDLRRLLLPGIVARQYHYLGSSWEAYSVKADKCRTRKKYDERPGPRAGVMYDMHNLGWMENAWYLLQCVGDYSELSKVYAEAGSSDIGDT